MNGTISVVIFTIGVPAAVSILALLAGKFFPKKETYDQKIKPIATSCGLAVSRFLNIKLGKKSAENVEENFIVTIAYWVENFVRDFMSALTEDNEKGK